ncbi:MAG: methylenetetrahydrofolate--tRNA-(uracil(54)-C(5))-methyltransferase (FADH(2)-oxidizing) TrmFO [Lachnospiraceae bacterium]|nr:methylenetetrahydrofolate--tRNA-(uracil(54)-C(5))-methyltransferase (FADH(2)-oxidizing) TrmFO [Lachnospiraceae bacterium]
MSENTVTRESVVSVFGAGLAGSEAAWQLAKRGVRVRLYEMKPTKFTPAHHSAGFAELVCSNSLRSAQLSNAVGLLKEELRRLGSLIMEAADASAVPAGSALAVDRELFSAYVTEKIRNHPLIEVIEEEKTSVEDGAVTVIATGPLTSDPLADYLTNELGCGNLHFFDAAAPIVDASTINYEKAFLASRYGKGEACYLNCPMTKEEYEAFYDALVTAEGAKLHGVDGELTVFEGCMPVEVMAKRGRDTLLFGPLKPVGLPDPKTGKEAYAVVQLRQENLEKTMYNLVGFQTHLTFGEQKRVFRMIPGLENAEFLRYGVMHRNTYLDSPRLLDGTYMLRSRPGLFFAGQMTGVEGYVESTSSGLVAGINAARLVLGKEPLLLPSLTAIGALAHYVSDSNVVNFQPMNANFGIVDPLGYKVKGKGKAARNEELSARSLAWIESEKETLLS